MFTYFPIDCPSGEEEKKKQIKGSQQKESIFGCIVNLHVDLTRRNKEAKFGDVSSNLACHIW